MSIQRMKNTEYWRGWHDGYDIGKSDAQHISPPLRGQWEKVDEQPYFRKHFHEVCCSVCKRKGYENYKYCSHCGAKMR